ncbi:hypothetical protein M3Y97_00459100 [Aphelenchoides bicaudatus]|nr:hypothetical protein M3Y97_00459100 [Aphelenchoides bicaudatus]
MRFVLLNLLQSSNQNFEMNSDLLEYEGKMIPKRLNERPGSEQLVKRLHGQNGILIRGADLRHFPKWVNQPLHFLQKFIEKPTFVDMKGKCRRAHTSSGYTFCKYIQKEREDLVANEPYGMDFYNLPYSLGKHHRWNFSEHFEENPESFQHPGHNITSTLMISDRLSEPKQFCVEQFPPLINGLDSHHRIRRMVAAQANGQLYTKETKTGRALPDDLLKPVHPIPGPKRQQPKHKKAARRYRRRETLRKREECQELPIRLTYFIDQPKTTAQQIQCQALRQKFTSFLNGKKCPKSQKHRGLLIQDEDCEYYDESMDFYDFGESFSDNPYEYQIGNDSELESCYRDEKPKGFSLGDYIKEETRTPSISNYVLVQYPTTHDFFQVSPHRNHSTDSLSSINEDDYELVEGFDF